MAVQQEESASDVLDLLTVIAFVIHCEGRKLCKLYDNFHISQYMIGIHKIGIEVKCYSHTHCSIFLSCGSNRIHFIINCGIFPFAYIVWQKLGNKTYGILPFAIKEYVSCYVAHLHTNRHIYPYISNCNTYREVDPFTVQIQLT